MTIERSKSGAAFTLVEVMAAIVIMSIAVIGASSYRYHAALDARKADMQMSAARVTLLLCEDWRGLKGIATYNPVSYLGSDLTIAPSSSFETGIINTKSFPVAAGGFTLLGIYTIAMDGVNYYAILSWKDVNTGLRALNVIVVWPVRGQTAVSSEDVASNVYTSFGLTTYTTL